MYQPSLTQVEVYINVSEQKIVRGSKSFNDRIGWTSENNKKEVNIYLPMTILIKRTCETIDMSLLLNSIIS